MKIIILSFFIQVSLFGASKNSLASFSYMPLKTNPGSSPEETIKKFGTPKKRSEQEVKNRHNQDQIDLIHQLTYKDFKISFYETRPENDDPRFFIYSLSIKGVKAPLKNMVSLNMKKSEILKKFGQPHAKKQEHQWSYYTGETGGTVLTFFFKNNEVVEIYWIPYLG